MNAEVLTQPRIADTDALIADMGARGRAAAKALAVAPTEAKATALRAAAAQLRSQAAAILEANARDMEAGKASGLSAAMLDRLRLDEGRLAAIAEAVEAVAALPDPVGQEIDRAVRPNGMELSRVRVPLGVVGIIYESRPNVTADAAALGLMSGNAVILRGGSAKRSHSNRAIHAALRGGAWPRPASLPMRSQLVPVHRPRRRRRDAQGAQALIDLIVPRGGKSLVARVQDEARVPVLAHLDGICHLYIDAAADPAMADRSWRSTPRCAAPASAARPRRC
jgi:glutamate-5-semialdehyde dehydrogenase